MDENDPRQVIIDYICRPQGANHRREDAANAIGGRPSMARNNTRPGGLGAKASTIRFHQQRSIADRQLHLVTFEDEEGHLDSWFCCVLLEPSGSWRFAGGNGGRAEGMPKRDYPWINMGGGWNMNLFWAGGRVLDNGLNVVRVRLVAENGIVLEDTVQDGIVMFVSNETLPIPVQVEMYDGSGKLVGTHTFPRHRARAAQEG